MEYAHQKFIHDTMELEFSGFYDQEDKIRNLQKNVNYQQGILERFLAVLSHKQEILTNSELIFIMRGGE